MTPKERAAMQQALEALESYSKSDYIKKQHPKRRANGEKAITALREALAEQAEQEPVAWYSVKGGFNTCGEGKPLYAAPAQKAEQEPVAFVSDVYQSRYTLEWNGRSLPIGTKLYAAPVRTKDLTDDEIYEAFYSCGFGATIAAGGRAVIAADREKNK